jgi:hypothetical protein
VLDQYLRKEALITSSALVQFKLFFLEYFEYVKGYYYTYSGEYWKPVICWELGCVVLRYFSNNSNNMADKDDDNFVMVSQIGIVEYWSQINFSR